MQKHQEWIILKDTGELQDEVMGGYTSVWEIVGFGMGRQTGELIYDRRGPSIPTTINDELAKGMGKAMEDVRGNSSGPIVRNIFEFGTIHDDVIEELRDRGVKVEFETNPVV